MLEIAESEGAFPLSHLGVGHLEARAVPPLADALYHENGAPRFVGVATPDGADVCRP